MQSSSNIPWNIKGKNGISSFFTEASYSRWLEVDSHEIRLAKNLRKNGLVLPPTPNNYAVDTDENEKPIESNNEIKGNKTSKVMDYVKSKTNQVVLDMLKDQPPKIDTNTSKTKGNHAKVSSDKVKEIYDTVMKPDDCYSTDTNIPKMTGPIPEEINKKHNTALCKTGNAGDRKLLDSADRSTLNTPTITDTETTPIASKSKDDNILSENDNIKYNENFTKELEADKSEEEFQSVKIRTDGNVYDPSTECGVLDNGKQYTTGQVLEGGDAGSIIKQNLHSIDSVSIRSVGENAKEDIEELRSDLPISGCSSDLLPSRMAGIGARRQVEHLGPDPKLAVQSIESVTSKTSVEKGAQIKHSEILTANMISPVVQDWEAASLRPDGRISRDPDEQSECSPSKINKAGRADFSYRNREDKYWPEIFKKKPARKTSNLTSQQQRTYLELLHKYGKSEPANPTPEQMEEIGRFKKLSEDVIKEQKKFQSYLKYVSNQCKSDYLYIHPEAEKYINAKMLCKKRRILSYPRYYCVEKQLHLPEEADNPPVLQYVRPLLELGSVCKMSFPSIIPGLPQPCTPTNYQAVSSVCPVIRDRFKGACVWNNEDCSQDVNAEQLAVPNRCNIVMSASAMKYLIDNQGNRKYYDMPITVREYDIADGDKKSTHQVVYLDKPLIKRSEFNGRDKNMMFQKHALHSIAAKPKQRAHIFSNIKPSAQRELPVSIDDVQNEMNEMAKLIEASVDCVNDSSSDDDTDFEQENLSRSRKKFRNKGKCKQAVDDADLEATNKKTLSVGLFDVDEDIDDLETFGMEMSLKAQTKSEKAEKRVSMDGKGLKSSPAGKLSKKMSAEIEMEILEKELKGIKTQAKIDASKTVNVARRRSLMEQNVSLNFNKGIGMCSQAGEKPENEETEINIEIAMAEQSADNDVEDNQQNPLDIVTEVTEENVNTNRINCETGNSGDKLVPAQLAVLDEEKTDISTKKEDKDKLLNIKNVSSLSAKMRQMSAIKTKLKLRSLQTKTTGVDAEIFGQSSIIEHPITSKSVIGQMKKNRNLDDIVSHSDDSESDSDGLIIDAPDVTTAKSIPDTPVSPSHIPLTRSNKDRLVYPSESIKEDTPISPGNKHTTQDLEHRKRCIEIPVTEANSTKDICEAPESPSSTPASPPASPIPQVDTFTDAPKSPAGDNQGWDLRKTCIEIPLSDDNYEDSVVRDYSEIKYNKSVSQYLESDCINASINQPGKSDSGSEINQSRDDEPCLEASEAIQPEATPSPKLNTRASKRRSMELNKDFVPVTKRALRSASVITSNPADNSESDTKRLTRRTLSKAEMDSSGNMSEMAVPGQTRGRGRKRQSVPERLTRSRSVSSDSHTEDQRTSQTEVGVGRRSTRHSLELNSSGELLTAEPVVPVKRKRGRSAKSSSLPDRSDEKHDEAIALEPAVGDQVKGEIGYKTCADGNTYTQKDEEISGDVTKRTRSPTKKMAVTVQMQEENATEEDVKESDEELDDASFKLPCRRGRPRSTITNKKKLLETNEAKRIKEMADAMKKKILDKSKEQNLLPKITKSDVVSGRETKFVQNTQLNSAKNGTVSEKPIGSKKISGIVNVDPIEQSNQPADLTISRNVSQRGDSIGIDNILDMQSEMLKPSPSKVSVPNQFAMKHLMNQVAFPLENNVTYHQWKIGGTSLLIRCSYHGYANPQGLVHISPKMEYQPMFGYERETVSETAQNWISVYVRPKSSLVRARINPFNSEIMKMEYVDFPDLIPQGSPFSSTQAFTDLDTILQQLQVLPVGQYMLRNNPMKDKFTIMKAVDNKDSGVFDLHFHHMCSKKGKVPRIVQWVPIDTRLMLPHHKKMHLVPCTYKPKGLGKKKQKKKKNRNMQKEEK